MLYWLFLHDSRQTIVGSDLKEETAVLILIQSSMSLATLIMVQYLKVEYDSVKIFW